MRRRLVRGIARMLVLLASDFGAFLACRELLQAWRVGVSHASLLGRLVHVVFPAAFLVGWEFPAALLIGLVVSGTYARRERHPDPGRLLQAATLATALILWSRVWNIGVTQVVAQFVGTVVLVWLGLLIERVIVDDLLRRTGLRRPHVNRTVLIGSAAECAGVAAGPAFSAGSDYAVVGQFPADNVQLNGQGDEPKGWRELGRVLSMARADSVVLCGHLGDEAFQHLVHVVRQAECELLAVPRQFRITGGEPQLTWRRGQPLIELASPATRLQEHVLKRAIDLVVSVAALTCLTPVFLVVMIAIEFDSKGPVFYRSARWGRFGRQIGVWKFRTMVTGAASMLERDPALRRAFDANIKLVDDPRVTKVGRFLRRWSLDELPQLINVLTGEMSLVGPRPKLMGEEERYGAAFETVLSVRPGMTGLWQVSGRNSTSYEDRIALDVKYASHPSLWDDLLILLKTGPVVLRGTGAH